MLISENKLRRIIRQEIIKENKRLNESKSLLDRSLIMLMMVCGAAGISPAKAQNAVEGPRKPLAQCVQALKNSPQSKTDIVQGVIKLGEDVLANKSASKEAVEVTTTTCEITAQAAGTLGNPGTVKLPK